MRFLGFKVLQIRVSRGLHLVAIINQLLLLQLQGVPKNDPTCFCQILVKSPPNLVIFGIQIAKTIKICKVHSLSTSSSLCQCTTV